jgi:hypothetical protein
MFVRKANIPADIRAKFKELGIPTVQSIVALILGLVSIAVSVWAALYH